MKKVNEEIVNEKMKKIMAETQEEEIMALKYVMSILVNKMGGSAMVTPSDIDEMKKSYLIFKIDQDDILNITVIKEEDNKTH